MLSRTHDILKDGGIIVFHGEKPFIVTSQTGSNVNPTYLAPTRDEVEEHLQMLLEGQLEKILQVDPTAHEELITIASNIQRLASDILDPSKFLKTTDSESITS